MRKKNFFLAVALALVALVAVVIVLQWRSPTETPSISIPSPMVSSGDNGPNSGSGLLQVSPDVVQELIASLERPDSYTKKYRVTRYWSGGESSSELVVYQKSSSFRMIETRKDSVKNTLILDGTVYYWFDGASDYVKSGLSSAGASVLDAYASLIIYEQLLSVPLDDIVTASHAAQYGENCIFVEYIYEDIYVHKLYVSADKGLLIAAQVLEDGETIYMMESESTELSVPGDDVFELPK